jgi:hypothetical protein
VGLGLDFTNPNSALTAAEARAEVLAAESTPVTTVGPEASDSYHLPYGITGQSGRVVRGSGDGSGGWTTADVGFIDWFTDYLSYARFTEVPQVPNEISSWGQVKSLYR